MFTVISILITIVWNALVLSVNLIIHGIELLLRVVPYIISLFTHKEAKQIHLKKIGRKKFGKYNDNALIDTVEEVMQNMKHVAEAKGIELSENIQEDIVWEIDLEKLKDILSKILVFCFDLAPRACKVSVYVEADRFHLIVSCRDLPKEPERIEDTARSHPSMSHALELIEEIGYTCDFDVNGRDLSVFMLY